MHKFLFAMCICLNFLCFPIVAQAVDVQLGKPTNRDTFSVATYREKAGALNATVCFSNLVVTPAGFMSRKSFPRNCARLKINLRAGKPQYHHIIFETKNMSFSFKTRNSENGNYKFWLREQAAEDTQNFSGFLSGFSLEEQAVFGGICKQISSEKWVRSKDLSGFTGSRIDSSIMQRINFKTAERKFAAIAQRCLRAVEAKIGTISLKGEAAGSSNKVCGLATSFSTVSNSRLRIIQSGLKKRGLYSGAIDGVMGKGSCAGFAKFMKCEARNSNIFTSRDYGYIKSAPSKEVEGCYNPEPSCDIQKSLVTSVQSNLKSLGFYKGKIDGLLGPGTRNAMEAGERAIFGKIDKNKRCIGWSEAGWLSVLNYAQSLGSKCGRFNSEAELKRASPALVELGFLSVVPKNLSFAEEQQKVVKAITRYEQQVSDEFFASGRGLARDCRLIPVEMKSLLEVAKPKPVTLYSLVEAQHFMEDLKAYLASCNNYFGSELADKASPVLPLPSAKSWDENDKKSFELLKDFALNAKPSDLSSVQCKMASYGDRNIGDFKNFHELRKVNREKSFAFAVNILQSELKSLIADGNAFRQKNPFDPNSASVKSVISEVEKGIDKKNVFDLLNLVNSTRQKYGALGVSFSKNKISLVNVEFLFNKEQLALTNKLAELNEDLKTREIENEVASKKTEVAALEELDAKEARFKVDAPFLFEDIRDFYSSGRTLGLDLAVYINQARGAEKSQDWSDELVKSFESLVTYVSQFEEFRQFRKEQAEKRSTIQSKLTADINKDIDRVISEIERWAAANPFAESSSILAVLVKEFGEKAQTATLQELEEQLSSLLDAVAEQGVELPISELLARRGYSLDGENNPIDSPSDVITLLRDAQRYILDIKDFNEDNPNAFGFELVRLYNSIRPILDNDVWDAAAKSSFRNLQEFVSKNENFVQFRYARVTERDQQLKLAMSRLQNDLNCLKAAGSTYIKKTLFEKDTSNIFEALEYASRFENSTNLNDYLRVIFKLRDLYLEQQIEHSCNEPLDIELLILSDEERDLVLSINRLNGVEPVVSTSVAADVETDEERATREAEERARAAEEEAVRKARDLAESLEQKRIQQYEGNAETARQKSSFLIEDIQAYLKDGNIFDVEFASKFAAVNKFLSNEIWTIEQYYEYVEFEQLCLSFEKFSNYQKEREKIIISKLNADLDILLSETRGLQSELTRWISANPLNAGAPNVLGILGALQSCAEPDEIQTRLDLQGVQNLKDCVSDTVQKLKVIRDETLKFCGTYVSVGFCDIAPKVNPKPVKVNITLSSAKSFVADLQEYVGSQNDPCIRSPELAVLAAPARMISEDVWTAEVQNGFTKLRDFALSCDMYAQWHFNKQKERKAEETEAKDKLCSQIEDIGAEMSEWILKNPFDASATEVLTRLDEINNLTCNNYSLEELGKQRVNLASFWNVIKPDIFIESSNASDSGGAGLAIADNEWNAVSNYVGLKETRFCKIIEASQLELEAALESGNQLKQNKILRTRDDDIEALLPDGKFSDWVARVEEVYSTPTGDAGFLLSIPCNLTIGTGAAVSGSGEERWYASAKPGTAIFNQLLDLSRGDFVLVSGSFLTYQEAGLTSSGQKFITVMGNTSFVISQEMGGKDEKAPDYLAAITYLSKL